MNTVDMTKGSPIKLLLQFSIPILIGNLFQQAYTLADRIIVGRFVGDTAFSAIGATNALSMTFMSMCMGAAIGTGVVVSQYFGAKDEKGTAASIANGGYTCILIALIMTIIALVTTKLVLLLLNTPESLMPDALTYMYIFMGGLIAVAAYFTPFSILRALGDSKTPLIFLVFCSLLNIVLDLLFVVVLKTGVAGAAFATGLQYALIYVSSIILQRIVNGFGESVIGAFTATTQIELLVQQIFAALGAAMVTYTGQNIGAGKTDRISHGVAAAMKISVIVSVILLAVFWLFGRPIMGIFVTNTGIISIAANGIRITSLFLMGLGGVHILRYMLIRSWCKITKYGFIGN